MTYLIIASVVVILDQVTKWVIVDRLSIGESIPVIEEIFYITSHRNAGAAFGILQDQRLFFLIVTIIVVIGVTIYLFKIKNEKRLLAWALSLILGGAIGNFIDRLFMGEVVDFLDVNIWMGSFYYDFPIFNVADSALVIGVCLIILDTILESIQESKQKKAS